MQNHLKNRNDLEDNRLWTIMQLFLFCYFEIKMLSSIIITTKMMLKGGVE